MNIKSRDVSTFLELMPKAKAKIRFHVFQYGWWLKLNTLCCWYCSWVSLNYASFLIRCRWDPHRQLRLLRLSQWHSISKVKLLLDEAKNMYDSTGIAYNTYIDIEKKLQHPMKKNDWNFFPLWYLYVNIKNAWNSKVYCILQINPWLWAIFGMHAA